VEKLRHFCLICLLSNFFFSFSFSFLWHLFLALNVSELAIFVCDCLPQTSQFGSYDKTELKSTFVFFVFFFFSFVGNVLVSVVVYVCLTGAIGKAALEKLQSNSVLVVGMKGLGLEIAKNIVLMGVKHLTIADNSHVQLRDLSSNFFLSESDVGKPRAASVRAKLQELNDRCELKLHEGAVTEEFVTKFRVVVLTDNKSREEMVRLAEACHRSVFCFVSFSLFLLSSFLSHFAEQTLL
jgi:hypothetical protein